MSALHITKENFENEVLKSEIPVLVDFWASWCGPCKMLMPVIEELAGEVNGVKICKINVDDEPELAAKYQVMTIPTLVVIQNGEVIKKSSGVIPKNAILEMLKA